MIFSGRMESPVLVACSLCHGGSEGYCYSVTGKTSSLDAFELFRENPDSFDLIITDQTMPGMTGVELAGLVLALRLGMPIILCTGHNTVINEEGALEKGIKRFEHKPLGLQRFCEVVREVLDEQRGSLR